MRHFSEDEIEAELQATATAVAELGDRELRLWQRIAVTPARWKQQQYPGDGPVWVVGVMGRRCLYFNHMEGGWGWGRFEEWGSVGEYHWQDLEIQHVVSQTLFAIDHGGKG
jgi:hypothetical protein